MEGVRVKVINHSDHPLPELATEGSAGMDIRAFLTEPVGIQPGERVMIGTGLHLEIPLGYEVQIRPRSGLAWKHGITVLNSPGTIDSDYRGEIKVVLINHSTEPFQVENGERIAQMILSKHETINWSLTDALEESARGSGGYGHTGNK
jgi:dUTP pyrophosphatase